MVRGIGSRWVSRRWKSGSPATQRVGKLCFGDTPTVADLCLVPQVFNARRFKIDMSRFPTLERIADHADQIDAFQRAAPAQQPDAE